MNGFIKLMLAAYAAGVFLGFLHGLHGAYLLGAGLVVVAFVGALLLIAIAVDR